MHALPDALAALATRKQFVVYTTSPSRVRPGKTDKFPVNPITREVSDAHNPKIWVDAGTACALATSWGVRYGVGFVFTADDPFWFVDIDDCLQADNTWSPVANQLCAMLPGAAVEVSQSGRGLHIIGSGTPPAHRCKNADHHIELYHELRFVALTGTGAVGNAATDLTHALPAVVATYFAPGDEYELGDLTDGPDDDWNGPTDDDELIRRALKSQSITSVFNGRAGFADLWTGNVEVLAKTYPDPARAYDASSADAALAQHLAFWTGRDGVRMERLMRQSALYRDKWDTHATYLTKFTIPTACARQREVLRDKPPEPAPVGAKRPVPTADLKPVSGSTFMNATDQAKLFEGCVYVRDQHRVLTPGGLMMNQDRFKAMYGGYTFSMDLTNERTTRNAWEALIESQAYRAAKVDTTCFRPALSTAAIIDEGGLLKVNTYHAIDVPRKTGDVRPFLNHLRKLLPDERDREILLAYMCACVQHKGVKFQWAPLLQGTEGNGKTLFTRCVAFAIGGRYVHMPKASQLAKNFNAWMMDKLFYGVEDIYVPGHKSEVIEELKPMITGDGLEIEGKGVDQVMGDICGNFMFNSNHKDAVRKTRNDRRFAIFYTAQQSADDVIRDGMGGDYFPKLYAWLKADGYAIVADLLHTRAIPDEFNPATACHRAPRTSTTDQAIAQSLGGIEQEILEAIAQSVPGFAGGWVSSTALDHLMSDKGSRVSLNKRRELMQSLGYDWHPGLIDGRVNSMVLPDGNKPRLFIRADHPDRLLTHSNDIARAYSTAQGVGAIDTRVNKGA